MAETFVATMMILRACLLWLVWVATAKAVVEGEPDDFAPALDGTVTAMHPTSDGGVVICGSFSEVNGTPRARIAKLFPDGSLDLAFDPGAGADGTIHCIAPAYPSGYYIGGEFLNYAGQARSRIAMISSSGALVTSFNPGAGANATVRCLSTANLSGLPATAVWVGGDFTQMRGVNCNFFAMLEASGQFGFSFTSGGVPRAAMQPNGIVRSFALTPQGMFIGGDFTKWGSLTTAYLVKVDTSSSAVTAFPGYFNGPVTALVSRSESSFVLSSYPGSLICMGSFTACKGLPRQGFAHFTTGPSFAGSEVAELRDTQMALTGGAGRCGIYPEIASSPDYVAQAYLGGEFTGFNDYPTEGLACLDALAAWPRLTEKDYLSPRAVSPQVMLPVPKVLAMAQTANGDRLYVGGEFSSIGGKPRSGIARLYGPALEAIPLAVTTLRASPLDDARVMLHWSSASRAVTYQLQRSPAGAETWTTLADSTKRYHLDTGLTPGTEYSYRVISRNFSAQTPGTLVVNATTDAGPWTGSGTAAAGQNLPAVSYSSVSDGDIFPDGRVVLAGSYGPVNGALHDSISILMPDGSLDPTFLPAASFSGTYHAVKVQPDGKILVAGSFSSIGGVARQNLARLNTDGSLDTGFTPTLLNGTSTSFTVHDVAVLPDGRVLAIGNFDKVDGHAQEEIALLMPDGRRDATFRPGEGIDVTSSARLQVLADGRFLVAGGSTYSSTSLASPFLMRPDGAVEFEFHRALASQAIDGEAVDVDALGRIYVGGSFTVDAPGGPRNLVRLLPDGTRDTTFTPPAFFTNSSSYGEVHSVRVMKDGKVLVYGAFLRCGDVVTGGIARLMPDGSLDPDFRATAALPYRFPDSSWSAPAALEIDPFNRAWIFGMVESTTGTTSPGLLCLDTMAEAPGTATLATATPSRDGGVWLEWTPGAHAYATRIEGRPAGTSEWSMLAEVAVPRATWWHQAAQPGSAWEYRLIATNKAAASAPGDDFAGHAHDAGRLWAAAAGVADLSDLEADPDGDGVPLSLEYAFGGNPNGPDDPRPEGWTLFGRFYLSYPRLRADLDYVVEQSQDGIAWTHEGVHQGPAGTSAFASVPMEERPCILLRVNVLPK